MTENENPTAIVIVIVDPFCVGNSHAWIVRDLSPTTARCGCGNVLRKATASENLRAGSLSPREAYVHADGLTRCPTYDCACGQRHNINRQANPEAYAAQEVAWEEAFSRTLMARDADLRL